MKMGALLVRDEADFYAGPDGYQSIMHLHGVAFGDISISDVIFGTQEAFDLIIASQSSEGYTLRA